MRPGREPIRQTDQTYFATFQTSRRQCFFRNERWSTLLITTLTNYQPQIHLHDFVIMPDHLHLLATPELPIERAIQLIKGGFSFQAKRAFEWKTDIWQPGFTDHRIRDIHDLDIHTEYIRKNTLSMSAEDKAFRGRDTNVTLHPFPSWLQSVSKESTTRNSTS